MYRLCLMSLKIHLLKPKHDISEDSPAEAPRFDEPEELSA